MEFKEWQEVRVENIWGGEGERWVLTHLKVMGTSDRFQSSKMKWSSFPRVQHMPCFFLNSVFYTRINKAVGYKMCTKYEYCKLLDKNSDVTFAHCLHYSGKSEMYMQATSLKIEIV